MIDFTDFNFLDPQFAYPVMIDGRLAGYVDNHHADGFINSMRYLKIEGKSIPSKT